jgi:hypothetical protein
MSLGTIKTVTCPKPKITTLFNWGGGRRWYNYLHREESLRSEYYLRSSCVLQTTFRFHLILHDLIIPVTGIIIQIEDIYETTIFCCLVDFST